MGDRKEVGEGRYRAGYLLWSFRDLLAAAGEGADADGQQPLQRLAHGRRLARPSSLKAQRARGRDRRSPSAATALLAAWAAAAPAVAQKPGGVLHAGHFDSPASMSM